MELLANSLQFVKHGPQESNITARSHRKSRVGIRYVAYNLLDLLFTYQGE